MYVFKCKHIEESYIGNSTQKQYRLNLEIYWLYLDESGWSIFLLLEVQESEKTIKNERYNENNIYDSSGIGTNMN